MMSRFISCKQVSKFSEVGRFPGQAKGRHSHMSLVRRSARDQEGFTLVELLVAMLLFMVLVSMIFVNLDTFMSMGATTNAALDSQNSAQVVSSSIEHYLPLAINACGWPPFVHAVNEPIISPTSASPMIFNASLGPDSNSPPSAVAFYFEPEKVVHGVQIYTAIMKSVPIPQHCGAIPNVAPNNYSDSQVYYPDFTWESSGGWSFYPLINTSTGYSLGPTPVPGVNVLIDTSGITANTDGSPWFTFCSAPGNLASPGTGYSVTGSNLSALSSPQTGSVPWGLGLQSIQDVALELTANTAPSASTQKATTAIVKNMFSMYNYSEYAPASPAMSSQACVDYVNGG